MAILVDVATDSVALGTDFVGLSLAYHFSVLDAVALSDDLSIEATFNTDLVVLADQTVVSLTSGKVIQDTAAVTDSTAVGFVRWKDLTETLGVTDVTSVALSYNVSNSDVISTTEMIHTWKPSVDGVFQASLSGDSELNAVLIKLNTSTPEVVAPPPKTVSLPKAPSPFIEHNVVNPNPRRT